MEEVLPRMDQEGISKSWEKGRRAFVNMHLSMYLYSPASKYPSADPRAFAACSVSGYPNLPERFCCWSCRKQSAEGEIESLWPSMSHFTQHWHVSHASALQTEWTTLALWHQHWGLSLGDSGGWLARIPLTGCCGRFTNHSSRGGHIAATTLAFTAVLGLFIGQQFPTIGLYLPAILLPAVCFLLWVLLKRTLLVPLLLHSLVHLQSTSHWGLPHPLLHMLHPIPWHWRHHLTRGQRSLYLLLLLLLLLLLPQLQWTMQRLSPTEWIEIPGGKTRPWIYLDGMAESDHALVIPCADSDSQLYLSFSIHSCLQSCKGSLAQWQL